jgi:hypothetical protein
MHFLPENDPLGLVEEAQRRREHYARYIERRVGEALERPATEQEIERQVERRVRERIAAESTAAPMSGWPGSCGRSGAPTSSRSRRSARSCGPWRAQPR